MEQSPSILCVICQSLLKNPVYHPECSSHFCVTCIKTYLQSSGDNKCPTCRNTITSMLSDPDLESYINQGTFICQCGQTVLCRLYDQHFQVCQANAQFIAEAIQQAPKPKEPVVNRKTFKCPLCVKKNFTSDSLSKHVQKFHRGAAAVCPICVSMPWGDPNYVSSNLASHLKQRHKYEVDTYTDFAMDDDEILRKVLEESKYTF